MDRNGKYGSPSHLKGGVEFSIAANLQTDAPAIGHIIIVFIDEIIVATVRRPIVGRPLDLTRITAATYVRYLHMKGIIVVKGAGLPPA